VGLTTGPIRSSSAGFVGAFELATVEECAGAAALRCIYETAGEGRGAVGGGGATTVGFGASQEPSGTRDAAAVLPKLTAERTGCADGVEATAEGRGAEGTVGLGAAEGELRRAAISTFPTGV
jgi:hypothetical protein